MRRLYLYRSRVRGTDHPDSDIDVAIEIIPAAGDSGALATWMHESATLAASLAQVLLVPLHLEWYGGPGVTPTVHQGLMAGSRIVYELVEGES